MVCFRYTIVNTLHKGDDDDDEYDDNNNNKNTGNNWSDWDRFKIMRRNHDVRELQKTAILGTAHILRKVLT